MKALLAINTRMRTELRTRQKEIDDMKRSLFIAAAALKLVGKTETANNIVNKWLVTKNEDV